MLIVSVHDVAPRTLDEVRWLLARLDAANVARRVLKVIPADGGEELDPGSELAAVLRDEQGRGSEIVQHGYTHRVAGPLRGDWLNVTRAQRFAPNDAELLSVGPPQARKRIRQGKAALERAGLAVRGFCAPAWLAPTWLDGLLVAEGFAYVMGLGQLVELARARHRFIPAFGYLGAEAFQERLVDLGGDVSIALHRLLGRSVPHLRAFLHPQGASGSDDCARTLQRIAELAAAEPIGTYSELLASG